MDYSSAIMESDFDETMDQSSDTLFNTDDEDVSLIEYARYYGLSKDYTTFDPLSPHILHSISAWEYLDLDITKLSQFKLPDTIELDEKWTIDLQSALFLKNIASLEVAPFQEITRHRNISAGYKTEPLLLPTDPELEQRRFIRARNSRLDQASQEVSSEALWQDDQEASLYWPEPDLPTTLIEQIKNERLQLDKNDILFLQQCISVPEKPDLQEIDVLPHKKAKQEFEAARHTSPLLPCSSPFQFSVPDSPVSRIPLATSPIDPVPAEIARIENTMDLDDDFSLDGLSDISAFDIASTSDTHFSSPLKRERPDDYKVEVPLSPALLSSSPMKKLKMVTLSDELCTTIPAYAKPFSSDDSNGTDEVGNFLEQVIKPGAHSALLAINSEHLTQADSMLRVEVPTVDLTSPTPPWKVFARESWDSQTELEAQQRLLSMLKREFIRPHEAWSNVGKVDRAMLRWRPFDMRLSDLAQEDIDCDYLDEFGPEEPQDTTLGWKLDGLRVLDPCEDDEEKMEAVDMSTMLENLDLKDDLPEPNASSKEQTRQAVKTLHPRQPFLSVSDTNNNINIMRSHENSVATQFQAPSTFSASDPLDHFMELCTGRKIAAQKTKSQAHIVLGNSNKPDTHTARGSNARKSTSSRSMHLPSLPASMPPRTFILSLTMVARRDLIKKISHLYPMAELIERDLTPPQVLRSMSSHTSEADEADLILAPGHGLMLTELQRLMQKSLPGQVTRNVVRERVVQLMRRYERLTIMVHEDRGSNQQRPLDSHESSELVSLINFCAAQNHDIQVIYIPGDESALATWVVASMVRYGLDDPEVQLLPETSSWELFLRKAGMDVFAAQVVLVKLKVPESMPASTTEQHYGLPAFIMMSEAERLRGFGTLFGGEKTLSKVSMAIDGSWTRDVVAGDLNGRKL